MGRYGSARASAASRDADADTIPLLHGEPSSVSSTRVGDGRHIRWALGVVAMSWLGVLCTLQVFGPHGVLAFVATAPRPAVTLGAAAIPPPKAASSKPAAGGGHAEPPHDTTTAPHHAHTTDARAKEGGASSGGQLSVPLIIGDNAVFQRAPESAAVWGWAPPGTTVTVQIIAPSASGDLGEGGGGAAKAPSDYDDAPSEDPHEHPPTARDADGKFADHWVLDLGGFTRAMATAVTDSTGSWTARLPPIQASYNLQLVISSPGMQSITRNNVAFGEVWLCSGQSNMQLAMAGAFDADADIADSGNYPLMRFATIKMQAYTTPVNDVPPYITVPPYTSTVWGVSAPEAFYPKNSVAEQADVSQPYGGGSPAMGGWFSAVCYTFGRRLYRHFDGTVPIGLVDASWGGKTIESFAPPTAMVDASCGMATGSAKSADAGDEQTVSAEGTDKWEKWPDHWRWKGTPTVDPSYGGGYSKPAIETADASPSSPSSPTNKKETGDKKSSGKDETGDKKSSGKDETGTTGNGDNGEPVKKLSTVDYLPPNATTPTPEKKEHSDASGKDEKAADVGHKENAMRPMRPDKQANAKQPAEQPAKAQANAKQPAEQPAKAQANAEQPKQATAEQPAKAQANAAQPKQAKAAQPAKAQANAARPSKQRRLADDKKPAASEKKPEPESDEPDSDDDLADIKATLDKVEARLRDKELTYEPGAAGQPGGTRRKILEEADKKPVNDKPNVSGGAAENDPFKAAAETADETADTGGNTDPYLTNGPSTIWNGMIYPIRKFRFAGVAWYQGESNFADPTKYACLFPATITGWRAGFENPLMAWAFVQLHAYDLHDWSEFRNAQVQATKKLPGVVMAAAIDLGDPTSPWDPIHPRYKQEVGRRLAQAVIGARYAQYGGVHYSGPKFVDAYPLAIAPEANNGVKGYRLTFENGNGGAAPATLHSSAAASCSQTGSGQCCGESPFIVVDAKTGNSVRVPYWLDNAGDNGAGAVVISTDLQVKEVRYAWERFPQCLLYNGVGGYEAYTDAMPAAPWCFDMANGVPCPVRNLPNPWAARSRSTADMGFTELLHKIPVADLIQWGQKDYAEEFRPASAGGSAGAGDGANGGAEGGADVGESPQQEKVSA